MLAAASLRRVARIAHSRCPAFAPVAVGDTNATAGGGRRGYHENIIEHYENPRNVGSLDKNDDDVGTVSWGDFYDCVYIFFGRVGCPWLFRRFRGGPRGRVLNNRRLKGERREMSEMRQRLRHFTRCEIFVKIIQSCPTSCPSFSIYNNSHVSFVLSSS
jgi:hypothetical protein